MMKIIKMKKSESGHSENSGAGGCLEYQCLNLIRTKWRTNQTNVKKDIK